MQMTTMMNIGIQHRLSNYLSIWLFRVNLTFLFSLYEIKEFDRLRIYSVWNFFWEMAETFNHSFSLCIFLQDYYVLFCANSPWNSFPLSRCLQWTERKKLSWWTIGPNGMSFKWGPCVEISLNIAHRRDEIVKLSSISPHLKCVLIQNLKNEHIFLLTCLACVF